MSTYKSFSIASLTRLVKLLVVSSLLTGCLLIVPLKPEANRTLGISEIPLAVGVYYDTAFRAYEHHFIIGSTSFNISVGESSVALFDEVFPIVFKRAVPVISRPPLPPGGPKVAAVIEPKIEEFKEVHPFILIGTTFSTEITYRLTLYSNEGEQIVSSTFMGHGEMPASLFNQTRPPGEATSLAMEEAVEKFMSDFPNLPQVQQWIRQAGALNHPQQ